MVQNQGQSTFSLVIESAFLGLPVTLLFAVLDNVMRERGNRDAP